MIIYIDESGSINNHENSCSPFFVVALVHVLNKRALKRTYKRFVSSNMKKLQRLDKDKTNAAGELIKEGGKMFFNGKFKELKGSQFDADMKRKFISFFSKKKHFEVFYIQVNNAHLTDQFCSNTARAFNYIIRLAISYFIGKGLLPNEECILQLDERNERTGTRSFLQDYLNTEIVMNGECKGPFSVQYFDSEDNNLIQIADVMSNLFFSHLMTNAYATEIERMEELGVIKGQFIFPLQHD